MFEVSKTYLYNVFQVSITVPKPIPGKIRVGGKYVESYDFVIEVKIYGLSDYRVVIEIHSAWIPQ